MNIKFVEDLKNSLMRVTIKLKKRKLAREERVMLGWYGLKDIVDEQYKCPNTHMLGECINPHQKMDNNYDHLLEKTWTFNLISKSVVADLKPPVVPPKKPELVVEKPVPAPKRKKKTKRTTVKK